MAHELIPFQKLHHDEPLTSTSGRYALHYDCDGVAVLTDRTLGDVCWRAGPRARPAAGLLRLGAGGIVEVQGPGGQIVWRCEVAAPQASSLTVTDMGRLELCSSEGVRLADLSTGEIRTQPCWDDLPASEITDGRYLTFDGDPMRFVTREPNGSLRISGRSAGAGWSFTVPISLARWLEQDQTVLTWRLLPVGRSRPARLLCLVRGGTEILWREDLILPRRIRDCLPVLLPPAAPHAYGDSILMRRGRLRHQSLTSTSGSHTLVHQPDGDLVLYCTFTGAVHWATETGWAGDGWAELSRDGDLIVRNTCGAAVWRSDTGGSGARRLVVDDDGTVALVDDRGARVWVAGCLERCTGTGGGGGLTVARGFAMRRGQSLRNQSLTSQDGGTVFVHGARGLTLFADDGRCLWSEHLWPGDRTCLVLDYDGILRARGEDSAVVREFGGPADELVVLPGELQLRRDGGRIVWRNGRQEAAPERRAPAIGDYESWMNTMM